MSLPSDHLELAAEFPATNTADWRRLVDAVLTKAGTEHSADAPELALTTETYDGITVQPLYTEAPWSLDALGVPGHAPFVRGSRSDDAAAAGWDVRQRHDDPDVERVNQAILTDLENGVTSLWLTFGEGAIAVADLPRALDGVYLDLAPIVLDAGAATLEAGRALLACAAADAVGADELAGSLGADPIGLAARAGAPAVLVPADLTLAVDAVALTQGYPRLHAVTVDATIYHDAGASDSQELAVAASAGVAYLRALTAAGYSVDAAMDELEFRYAVTDDQFASIAKLRAARRIWNRIGELSGAAEASRGQRQHAVTSAAMVTRRDPWVNMLRTTIACFAAAVGGAEAITVAPFDTAIGRSDAFARRIARNTQSVLHDESSLARVMDPAGGSWYVETLTEQLAQAAWATFTALEALGGAGNLAAVAELIETTRTQRDADIAHRVRPITGVSEFPNLAEQLPLREQLPPAVPGGLVATRYAAAFEALRDRSDAVAVATGVRPAVFLAALGPVAAHSGRVGFASNLFQAGGFEPVVATGTAAELAVAFTASGASVACLCSSDKIYAEQAAPTAQALTAAGAGLVWLAGQGGPRADSDAAAGIAGYVYVGVDALAVLNRTMDTSGVPT